MINSHRKKVLQQKATDFAETDFKKHLLFQTFYTDDFVVNEKELQAAVQDMLPKLSKGGCNLTKMVSNSEECLLSLGSHVEYGKM